MHLPLTRLLRAAALALLLPATALLLAPPTPAAAITCCEAARGLSPCRLTNPIVAFSCTDLSPCTCTYSVKCSDGLTIYNRSFKIC